MVDDWTVKYCYDGDHTIAEYDGENRLLRKYIYGPRVDEPVCMIDVADSNAVYYYHFDGLGSVIALSDEDGNTVQTYEYTVYGQVAAEDVNHPNPITFTGRWFDKETGLYYYRARYYNPEIGRFLQTDPVGYGYVYCGNNPVGWVDPSGLTETYVPYAYLYERGNLWYLENVAEPEYHLHWSTWGLSDRFNVAMGGVITTGFTIDGLPLIYIDTSKGPPSYEYVPGLDTCYGNATVVEDEDLLSYAEDLVSGYTPAATAEPATSSDPLPTPDRPERPDKRIEARGGPFPRFPLWPRSLTGREKALWDKVVDDCLGEIPGVKPHVPKGPWAKLGASLARLIHMRPTFILVPEIMVPGYHPRPRVPINRG